MKNKIVVITGGSSGIGKALAFEFGKHENKIAITGRNTDTLESTKLELEADGIECLAIRSDASKEQDAREMADRVVSHFGGIDVLIK